MFPALAQTTLAAWTAAASVSCSLIRLRSLGTSFARAMSPASLNAPFDGASHGRC